MTLQRKALITGCTGQDGSYLAEFLLEKGYEVHGVTRRSSSSNTQRIDHISDFITLHQSDITDQGSLTRLVENVEPDEVYNLAAQSFVHASWDHPVSTSDMTGLGVTRLLEAVRQVNDKIKFYQASSSEMYGKVQETPQKESTKFYPRSPYGVAKLYGHWMTVNYRESHGMFCVSGILFNHESPRRGLEFVTRKITNAVARIKMGLQDSLALGYQGSKRDWGFAGDYVRAMWMMLQQDKPVDYVIATGETHSVADFVQEAFSRVDLDPEEFVVTDERFMRPAEVNLLCGDPSKAKEGLGWEPRVTFKDLVGMMVDSDLKAVTDSQP